MADYDARVTTTEKVVGTGGALTDVANRLSQQAHDTTGRHLWKQGTDIASASTITFPDSSSGSGTNFYDVTGTTTITAANAKSAGALYILKFDGALTLQHTNTSFEMPGDANVTIAAGDVVTLHEYSSGNFRLISHDNASSSPTVGVGSYSGLVVLRASATTVDIDADGVVLTDGTNTYQASSVNLTADITASGANGLDTGSEATTTWYYAYVIYNGTTVSSLLSVSATSPTMPSGYTYKKRVGAVYNDGGGDIEQSRQYGNVSFFDIQQTAFLSGGSAASFTQLTPSPLPTTAFQAYVFMEFGKFDAHLSIDGTNIMSAIGDGSDNHQGNQLVPLDTSRQFYYKKRGGSESGNMSVAGWIDNI